MTEEIGVGKRRNSQTSSARKMPEQLMQVEQSQKFKSPDARGRNQLATEKPVSLRDDQGLEIAVPDPDSASEPPQCTDESGEDGIKTLA